MSRNALLVASLIAALSVTFVPEAEGAGFRLTFGWKRQAHGRTWNGGMRNPSQVSRILGWHLDTEDKVLPGGRWQIGLRMAGGQVHPKGVVLEVVTPEDRPVTFHTRYGDFSFVPAEVTFGNAYEIPNLDGDVRVERVPLPTVASNASYENDDPALLRTRGGEFWLAWVGYQTLNRRGHYIEGGDRVLISRSRDGKHWSTPKPLTPFGDHFRVALAEDSRGQVWCIYSLQKQPESGNFDLFGRTFDGTRWSDERQLTTNPLPDIFHKVVADDKGNLVMVWMGFRGRQSDVLMRIYRNESWGPEINVSNSDEDDWEPAVAVAESGRASVAWDSYRSEGTQPPTYDLLLREWDGDSLGPLRIVSATRAAEMRADLAFDSSNRLWVTWEEGGANWGKDTGYRNPRHDIYLRPGGAEIYRPRNRDTFYRHPRVAVIEGAKQKQPDPALSGALRDMQTGLRTNLFQNPRLARAGDGTMWVILRHQLTPQGRWGGHMFDLYATRLGRDGWLPPVPLPGSTGRQDTIIGTSAAGDGVLLAVVGDGRRLPVGLPEHHEVALLELPSAGEADRFTAFRASAVEEAPVTHPNEPDDLARIRSHRITAGEQTYKIVRGDLHRHSEISMDGATDGSLWDLYRYALNATGFEFFAVTDHNYGAWLDTDEPESANTDDIYQWWRTQKSADIFHVPGRFVPLYGYERSINFPLGHVNIFHPRRGVFSYRVPKLHIAERPELTEQDARGLAAYLSATGGVGVNHTSATIMGTDWKYHDDTVIPVVEIYQGDRNSYEEEGTPRSARRGIPGLGWAGREPFQKGLVRNALGVGMRLGFIASSDHYSTHISYANLLVPEGLTTREHLQDAIMSRRAYASTDNIILDFTAGDTVQGGEMTARASPTFKVNVRGTEPILRIDLIKNNRRIFTHQPKEPSRNVQFTFRDESSFADTTMAATSQITDWSHPESGLRPRPDEPVSYYYVRVLQSFSSEAPNRPGEVAWSSPIYVRQR